ncbi:helix-turn-helix domain-containing protein [Paenibacillus lycopersici]|uniref:Helix-turn-helix domain-containing protein n=1 Tax=Paenibacillus lycopersici TaxID=2704462 RepID=A0A6C0FZC3_9BACL|nr:helix-turn-helix domain-containing protein [Paenibacillus lycopersici]QHT62488.1 helix-turn-helix domain-containing protein [Paenibacillus lycopersici]
MYRVLLADDESLDLEGLERLIPWEKLGMEVAAAVSSGYDALAVLRAAPIDILVSDIKMPIMSGLELAKRALESNPSLKIVFVSGYEDFHYAKQAIQLNVQGYVLKPVDDYELIRVLTEVKQSLDQSQEQTKLEQAYKQSVTLARNELLLRWLEGPPMEDGGNALPIEMLDETGLRSDNGPFHVALLEADDLHLRWGALSEEARAANLQRLFSYIAQSALEKGANAVCRTAPDRIAVLSRQADFDGMLEQVLQRIRESNKATVTAAVGPSVQTLGEVGASYRQAKAILASKIFMGKDRILSHVDNPEHHMREAADMDRILEEMFAAVSAYELVRIDDALQELVAYARSLGNRLTVYNFTFHIVSKLDIHLKSLNENLQRMLGIEFEHLDILFHFETIYDIQSWLRKRLFEISELLHRKKLKKNRKLIDELEAYVSERLDSAMSLRELAGHFMFSPNYLGHLFKEETGENLSDYIIRRRFERACELLRDPKLKVFEVAHRIGYTNLTYFSRQFRELFGMTPNEFRRQC